MIRRINLFAGPGAGKTTIASYLFHRMKADRYNVEYSPEYIKNWVYENRSPKFFDQIYIFAKQLRNEDIILTGGVDFVICDSPLLLTYYYAKRNNVPGAGQLWEIAKIFEDSYPSYNIFINRSSKYENIGRYHTEEEAHQIDEELLDLIKPTSIYDYNQGEEIYNNIKGKVERRV